MKPSRNVSASSTRPNLRANESIGMATPAASTLHSTRAPPAAIGFSLDRSMLRLLPCVPTPHLHRSERTMTVWRPARCSLGNTEREDRTTQRPVPARAALRASGPVADRACRLVGPVEDDVQPYLTTCLRGCPLLLVDWVVIPLGQRVADAEEDPPERRPALCLDLRRLQ